MIRNADPIVENSDPGILKNPAPKMGKLSSKIVKTQLKIRKPSSKSGKTQFLRLLLSVRNRVRCTKDKPGILHVVRDKNPFIFFTPVTVNRYVLMNPLG